MGDNTADSPSSSPSGDAEAGNRLQATLESLTSVPRRVWNAENKGLKLRMAISMVVIAFFYLVVVLFLIGFAELFVGSALGGYASILVGIGLTVLLMAAIYVGTIHVLIESEMVTELPRAEYEGIYEETETLCADMEVEMPALHVAQMGVPNAFAIGRRANGHVVLSETMLETLETDELVGVVAHELAHLKNRDSVIQMFAVATTMLVGFIVHKITMLYVWVLMLLFAVMRAMLDRYNRAYVTGKERRRARKIANGVTILCVLFVTLFTRSLSRQREYHADATAAKHMDEDGEGLTRALGKVESYVTDRELDVQEETGDVPMALCVYGESSGILERIFATHPAMEKRRRALEA